MHSKCTFRLERSMICDLIEKTSDSDGSFQNLHCRFTKIPKTQAIALFKTFPKARLTQKSRLPF